MISINIIYMLDLTQEQIRSFLAVVKYSNFSRAAEKTFRTQAAVSIQISRLEEQLGTVLFLRSSKPLELTPAGEVLFHHLQRVQSIMAEAGTELMDLQDMKKGRLVLSTSDTTACYYLPDLLRQFHLKYPGIEIQVQNTTSPNTRKMVRENRVDLGIVTLRDLPKDVKAIPLFPRKDCLICHPQHPLARRDVLFLKDLEPYSCILLDDNCSTRRILNTRLKQARVNLKITMELSSVEVIKRFVQIDAGISLVPQMAVIEELAQGRLASVELADYRQSDAVSMGILYNKNRYLSKAAEEFISLLRSNPTPGQTVH